MAKKKNEATGGLIFLVILLVGIVIIATPIVMVFGTLLSLITYLKIKKGVKGNYSDFWLDDKEKLQFRAVSIKLIDAIENMEKANKMGDDESLARNKDGSFALRGNRGKEVQGFINKNDAIKDEYLPLYDYLKILPLTRWLKFRKVYTRFYCFLISSVAWLVVTAILISKEFPDFFYGVNLILRVPLDLKKMFNARYSTPDTHLQWKILLISAGVSLLVNLIVLFTLRLFVKKVSPMPPEVNIANIDKY